MDDLSLRNGLTMVSAGLIALCDGENYRPQTLAPAACDWTLKGTLLHGWIVRVPNIALAKETLATGTT